MSILISTALFSSGLATSITVNGSPKVLTQTTNSSFYNISFNAPTSDDLASIFIQITGFKNRYSTDDVAGGIQFQTSLDGYLIDISPVTPLADSLVPTSASLANFSILNTVVGQQTSMIAQVLISGFARQNDVVQIQSLNQNFYQGQEMALFYNGV